MIDNRPTALCLVLLLLFISFSESFGDDREQWSPSFGLRLGTSLSQHVGTEERNSEYEVTSQWRTGFTGGITAYLPVTSRFGFQQELLYTQRGSDQDIGVEILELPTVLHTAYRMDYLDIPVLARLSLINAGSGTVYSLAGTAMSVRLQGSYRLEGQLDDGTETIPIYADADLSEVDLFDFSMVYGTGFEFPFQGTLLQLEYRFTMGWNTLAMPTYAYVPFEEEDILIENDPVPLKNQSHALSIGVRF